LDTQHLNAILESIIERLKNDSAFRGPPGPPGAPGATGPRGVPGPAGPAGVGIIGPPGRGVESIEVAPDGTVTVLYTDGSTHVAGQINPPQPPPVTGAISHFVLVRDTSASYWTRMADELNRARGFYSGIEEADPPDFSVQLPQLIGYRDGSPVYIARGVRDVSTALSAITRGEFELTE
jgi:hypothetical protein